MLLSIQDLRVSFRMGTEDGVMRRVQAVAAFIAEAVEHERSTFS